VFTGIAIRRGADRLQEDHGVATAVTFKPLTDALIETYLARVHVLDKAGSYAIQEHGELIVDHYDGSWTNIVGLPMETTKQILTRHGLVGLTARSAS